MGKINTDFLAMLDGFAEDDENKLRSKIVKIPFGYPGGKSRSYKKIIDVLPRTGRFVEVFGGTGVVLLNREEEKLEVYNDRYSALVDFYRCLYDDVKFNKLISLLEMMPQSRELFILSKTNRDVEQDTVLRAAYWYYSIENSFSCLGRNFGRSLVESKNKIASNLKLFPELNRRLKNVLLENLDWKICMKDFDAYDTVFYLDPPYMDTTTSGNIYKERGMSAEDHKELCDYIFSCKGYVAVSGYENEIYSKYPWDDVKCWDVFISMTSQSKAEESYNKDTDLQRGNRQEYLYIKEAE